MGRLAIVDHEVLGERHLHLLDDLEPGASLCDPEVLVDQGAVELLDGAIGLLAIDRGGAVLEVLELEVQLVGVAVR